MTKENMRKPVNALIEEKEKINAKLINIRDRLQFLQTQIATLRGDEHSYSEAKMHLGPSASAKASKAVFDEKLRNVRVDLEKTQKEWEAAEKERVIWSSKLVGLEKAIKDLNNA